MSTDRIVPADSGGLDTSVAIGWIAEQTGAEAVAAAAADVGRGGEDLEVVRQRALDCGAVEAVVADVRDEDAEDVRLPALQAAALCTGRSPLVSALSRPLSVEHLVAGRRTTSSLFDSALATYDAGDTFDQSLVRGSVEPWGLPGRIAACRDQGLRDLAAT